MCRHIIRQVIDINREKKWTENGSLWLRGTPRFRKDIDARHTFQGLKSSLGTSQGLQPQKFQSGSSCGTFESTEQKKKLWYEIKYCFLKKNLPSPQNRIFIPFQGFCSKFLTSTHVLLIWESPQALPYSNRDKSGVTRGLSNNCSLKTRCQI